MGRIAPSELISTAIRLEQLAQELKAPFQFDRPGSEDILRYERDAAAMRRRICNELIVDQLSWEIVRELYLARSSNQCRSIKQVMLATNAPGTTALRYIQRLVEGGVLVKEASRTDARVSYLWLTEHAAEQIEAWTHWVADRFMLRSL